MYHIKYNKSAYCRILYLVAHEQKVGRKRIHHSQDGERPQLLSRNAHGALFSEQVDADEDGAEQKPVKKRGIERIAGMFDRKCEKRYCAVCDCRYAGERVSFGLDVHGMVVPRKADAANLGYFVLTGKGGSEAVSPLCHSPGAESE